MNDKLLDSDKLLDDDLYKTIVTNNTPITSIPNGYTVCDGGTANTYEKFLDSFSQAGVHIELMTHLQSKIDIAKKLFDGYLTDEELQIYQYEGRFWDISLGALYILVDDDTLVIVDVNGVVGIYGRERLPESLKGRHYYE